MVTMMHGSLEAGRYLLVSLDDLKVYELDPYDDAPHVIRIRCIGPVTRDEVLAAMDAMGIAMEMPNEPRC